MYYVYCPETGEELMCDTNLDAVKVAKAWIRTALLDGDEQTQEVFILEPVTVITGQADISFNVDRYEETEETVDTEDHKSCFPGV